MVCFIFSRDIWRVLCSTEVGCVSRDGISLLETRQLGRHSLGPPVAARRFGHSVLPGARPSGIGRTF